MIPIDRKQATKRLREPVKDFIAEGGKILASDDELIFAVQAFVPSEMPAAARPAPRALAPVHPARASAPRCDEVRHAMLTIDPERVG